MGYVHLKRKLDNYRNVFVFYINVAVHGSLFITVVIWSDTMGVTDQRMLSVS